MKQILTLLLLMLLAIPVYSADQDTVYRIDIQTFVYDKLGGESSVWPASVVQSEINFNCREYATFIGISKEDTILTVNGLTDYTLNTDFWTVRGVVKLSDGRKKMLRRKGIDETAPHTKGFGEETITANKIRYYGIKDGQTIMIDPPESAATTDTIIISYNTYATELTGDSTITNIRYGGIPVVVWGTVLNCMIRNREDAFVQIVLPTVKEKYQMIFNATKEQERSSVNYDPSAKPQ